MSSISARLLGSTVKRGVLESLIFDLDGTLVDSSRGIIEALERTVHELIGRPLSNDERAGALGPPLPCVLSTILPQAGVAYGVSRYREIYRETFARGLRLYPCVREVLEVARKEGVRLGIATNKRQDFAERIVAHMGIDGMFELVCGTEENGIAADKEAVLKKMTPLISSREGGASVMVGDRADDTYSARSRGLLSVGVLWGYGSAQELSGAQPSALVEKVTDLLSA